MSGSIYPILFAKSKIKTPSLVSVSVSILISSLFFSAGQKAFAWPAVINSPKTAEVEPVKSESRLTRGIQKTLAEGHYRVGLRLKKKKQWEEALTQFLEATNKNPNHFKSFFEQALIYRQKQLHDMSVTCLQQALTIKPKFKDARVLLAALQLEKGNVGSAFEQLKESLGIKPNGEDKNNDTKADSDSKDSDTILQTIHTFIEATSLVANVVTTPSLQTSTPEPSDLNQIALSEEPAAKQEASQPVENHKKEASLLIARQPQLVSNQKVTASAKNLSVTSAPVKFGTPKSSRVNKKIAVAVERKTNEDEWTRKLRFLAKNGTGSLKNGEAFLFSEETGEAILILADGRRIVRSVETPKDQETIVQMRRPDMLVPDDLLYNLSLLGKVVADAVSPEISAAEKQKNEQAQLGNESPTDSNSGTNLNSGANSSSGAIAGSGTTASSPPSFKLESGQGDGFVDSLEPKKMVHWLKDVLHL